MKRSIHPSILLFLFYFISPFVCYFKATGGDQVIIRTIEIRTIIFVVFTQCFHVFFLRKFNLTKPNDWLILISFLNLLFFHFLSHSIRSSFCYYSFVFFFFCFQFIIYIVHTQVDGFLLLLHSSSSSFFFSCILTYKRVLTWLKADVILI